MSTPTEDPQHTEEDFLEVDKPVPGQNFVCLSFVSPEKTLMNKEQWMFYHYHQYVINEYHKIFSELTDKILDTEEETVSVDQVVDLRKRLTRVFDMNEVEYNNWQELVEDYKFRESERLDKEFDEMNNFQTSVRGIKVRGVYDTYREAEVRSKVLQRMDNRFDVFIGQVGYWLPWHPDTNKIQDQEYMNDKLNTLVKEYKKNEEKRDLFYQQQKQERVREAREQVERAKALAATTEETIEEVHTTDVSAETQPTTSNQDQANSLLESDPWMKRNL